MPRALADSVSTTSIGAALEKVSLRIREPVTTTFFDLVIAGILVFWAIAATG